MTLVAKFGLILEIGGRLIRRVCQPGHQCLRHITQMTTLNANSKVWIRSGVLILRREKLDMKLTDFARKVEVDYTLLRNAEGGKKRFTLRNAIRIANAYGFEVSDVLCNSKEEAQEILRTYEHPLDPMACRSLIAGIILQSINDYTLYKNMRPEIEDFFNSKYFATIYDHKKGADFIKLCKKRARSYNRKRGFRVHGTGKEGYVSRCI